MAHLESTSTGLLAVGLTSQAEIGTITHAGRDYSAGGAYIDPYRLVCYLKARPFGSDRSGLAVSWDGQILGTYTVTSSWKTLRSWVSSHWYAVRIRLDSGAEYCGRSAGVGMVCFGKRAASQLQPITRGARKF